MVWYKTQGLFYACVVHVFYKKGKQTSEPKLRRNSHACKCIVFWGKKIQARRNSCMEVGCEAKEGWAT